jgi:hypothetical protein
MSVFRKPDAAPAPILRYAAFLMLILATPALAVAPAAEQIFKCTDGSGNVTYQNEPCPKNVKAGRVEIFDNSWTADRVEREAEWRRNAVAHRVTIGMPVRLVREALGEPAEVRDTATAGAAEVWVYSFPDRGVQVGMLNNQVLWFREAPVAPPVARAATEPDRPVAERAPFEPQATRVAPASGQPPELPVTRLAPPAQERPRDGSAAPAEASRAMADAVPTAPSGPAVASTSRTVSRGQDCKQALADLGPPDRQREVPAIDAGSDAATEYFYEPSANAGVGATRMRIVCANGKVEGVDRAVVR